LHTWDIQQSFIQDLKKDGCSGEVVLKLKVWMPSPIGMHAVLPMPISFANEEKGRAGRLLAVGNADLPYQNPVTAIQNQRVPGQDSGICTFERPAGPSHS